jgi:hypothetical protein
MEYEEIISGLREIQGWNDFAASLLSQYGRKGALSERQWDAAERTILKTREAGLRREQNRKQVDVSRISNLLKTAVESGLKKPAFRVGHLQFSLAPTTGRNVGAVYVRFQKDYAGKIMGGVFMPVSSAPDGLGEDIAEIAKDPRGKAVEHGRMTGRCSCCGRELSDPKSVALGIGPVCADQWGL